jgi:HEAT repeat protein
VRNYSTLSVGKTRNPEAIEPLIKALKEDEDDRVRDSAAKALHQIGTPAVDPLIEELGGTKDMEIVIRIAQTLGDIGDKRAIKPLEKVYNEATNPLLKNETAKALNKID